MISFGPKKTLTTDHADNIKAVEELLKASESAGAEGCCSEPDGAQLERVASSREKETPLEAVRRLWAANPGIGVKKMAALVKVEGLPFGTKAVRQALEQVKGEEAVESAPEPAPAPESAPAPAPATVHKEPMSEIEQILERDGTFDEWTPFCEQVHGDVTSLDDPGPYMLCGEGGDVCEGNGWGSGGLQLKSDLRGDFCKEMTMLCKNPYCALGPENMEMGPNQPCICGSGIKTKKCKCLTQAAVAHVPETERASAAAAAKQQEARMEAAWPIVDRLKRRNVRVSLAALAPLEPGRAQINRFDMMALLAFESNHPKLYSDPDVRMPALRMEGTQMDLDRCLALRQVIKVEREAERDAQDCAHQMHAFNSVHNDSRYADELRRLVQEASTDQELVAGESDWRAVTKLR